MQLDIAIGQVLANGKKEKNVLRNYNSSSKGEEMTQSGVTSPEPKSAGRIVVETLA